MAIRTGEDYIQSLRGRDLKVYLFGELVKEPVDHPMIRPSINAVAETYDLAVREEDLASATSAMTGKKISRFLHIAESAEDLVMQNKMQRKLGQNTATCFQRCVYRGTDHGMVYRLFYQLTKKIYFEVSSTQTLDVVLSCSDRHVL